MTKQHPLSKNVLGAFIKTLIKMFKSQLQEVLLIPFKKRQEMSILLNIREIQIKTTMRYHLTLVRMAFIKHSKEPRLERAWRNENPPPSMLGCKLGTATVETACVLSHFSRV